MKWISALTGRVVVRRRDPAEPYSLVGRWFLATLLQDEAQRREYGQLIADDQGDGLVADADFIVVRLVFESLVRREFSLSNDPREINQFTTELLRTRRQLDQLQVAAVIRGALSDRPIPYHGFEVDQVVMIFGAVTFDLVQSLRLSKSDVLALVLESERLAPDRGVNLVSAAGHSRNSP